MEIANRITVDEKVRFGKPVIKGARVPVDLILGKLAGGMTYVDWKRTWKRDGRGRGTDVEEGRCSIISKNPS